MSNKILKIDSLEEYATLLAKENIKLIKDVGQPLGSDYTKAIFSSFLAQLVEGLVLDALNEHKDNRSLSKGQIFEKTSKGLNVMKNMIQGSIADGLSSAIIKWSGVDMHYYCVIKPEPKGFNKVSN